MGNHETENIEYPSIVFQIGGELFCVSSKYIASIMQLPEYERVPGAPPEITGIFKHREGTVTMLDLRRAMRMETLDDTYQDFCDMLDARKQDHIHWVDELEKSVETGEPFKLATDPHKCKFGQWFYNFHSNVPEINFHLKKIEGPHNRLHQAALEVERCSKDCDSCRRDTCLKKILARARGECMPEIISLLDETKEVFHSRMYHEMALVLRGSRKIGIIVDEVLSVEDLRPADAEDEAEVLQFTKFISGVQVSDKLSGLILEVDVPRLIESIDTSCIDSRETRVGTDR